MNSHWHMYGHWLGLADPMDTIVALFFYCRVPPTGQVNDMGRCGQRKPRACSPWAKHQDIKAII